MRFTFKKSERLSSKTIINKLFKEGIAIYKYPFKVMYFEQERNDDVPVKVLVSVSKRSIRSAVKRNLVKRQIREVYRKNKQILTDVYSQKPDKQLLIAIIYTGKTIMSSAEVDRKLIIILHGLTKTDG